MQKVRYSTPAKFVLTITIVHTLLLSSKRPRFFITVSDEDFCAQCSHPVIRTTEISGNKCRLNRFSFSSSDSCHTVKPPHLSHSVFMSYCVHSMPWTAPHCRRLCRPRQSSSLLRIILGDNRDKRFRIGLCADIFTADYHLHGAFWHDTLSLFAFHLRPYLNLSFSDVQGRKI